MFLLAMQDDICVVIHNCETNRMVQKRLKQAENDIKIARKLY